LLSSSQESFSDIVFTQAFIFGIVCNNAAQFNPLAVGFLIKKALRNQIIIV